MFSAVAAYIYFILGLSTYALAQNVPYQPCPIQGPRFPKPTGLLSSKFIQAALADLNAAFDNVTDTGSSEFTATTPNTTSFSVVLFAANETGNNSEPFIYEYHHTAPDFEQPGSEVQAVDADSVYNIGGLTQIFTVYAFLVAAGEKHWMDAVTQHVTELSGSRSDSLNSTSWDDILLLDLATYLAGIPATDVLDSLSIHDVPSTLAEILPPSSISANASSANRQEFLQAMTIRPPIYKPGTTAIYSDAGFQMLALAMESIAGKTYSRVMMDSIIGPLNMSSTSVGTPQSMSNAIIPVNATASGWQPPPNVDSFLLAASSMFSSVKDLAIVGKAIIESSLISSATTRRWFKPHAHSSNLVDDIGAPWVIFTPTIDGESTGAIIPAYTKLGPNGLYSPYFGIVPDYDVGFAILSADTTSPADLNAYVDFIVSYLPAALEKTAIQQAAVNFKGDYSGSSADGTSNLTLTIDVDKLSGLSLTDWTSTSSSDTLADIRAAYADLASIPAATLDFRLYPTNLRSPSTSNGTTQMAFRGVLQDTAAPVDGGTPTCVTWFAGVDTLVWNGRSMDEFVFELDVDGSAVAVEVPALGARLIRS